MRIASMGAENWQTGAENSERGACGGCRAGAGCFACAGAKKSKEPKADKGQGKTAFSKEFSVAAQPLQLKLEAVRLAKVKVDAKDPAGPAELEAALAGSQAMTLRPKPR